MYGMAPYFIGGMMTTILCPIHWKLWWGFWKAIRPILRRLVPAGSIRTDASRISLFFQVFLFMTGCRLCRNCLNGKNSITPAAANYINRISVISACTDSGQNVISIGDIVVSIESTKWWYQASQNITFTATIPI